jgi:SHS2 domain-containing protein
MFYLSILSKPVPVETLEHTADVRLRAWGRSFQGTLLELSNHMLKMVYGESIQPDLHIASKVEFESDEECVARLLNDLIYQSESAELAIRVRKITLCERTVLWEGDGEIASKKERGSVLVKAATYDRIVVRRNPPLIEITLDI